LAASRRSGHEGRARRVDEGRAARGSRADDEDRAARAGHESRTREGRPLSGPSREELRESERLEAFSDGVFAIAITLLVLELKVPPRDADLAAALLSGWPSYVAFLTSFATIGIMWLNHHRLFTTIRRVDHGTLVLNGLLLLGVTALPFPTAIVA